MAEGPINYAGMLTQPDFTPLLQGLQLRRQNKAIEAQTEIAQQKVDLATQEAQAKAQQNAAWQGAVGNALQNPTTENYQKLFAYPDRIDAAKQLLGNYTDQQKNRNLSAAMEVGGLINAGATDSAIAKLKDRRTALAQAGESTEITDHIIANLESGDPAKITQAKGLAGTVIAMTLGDKAGPVLDSLGYGAKAEDRKADNARQAAAQAETMRHNRAMEGNAAGNLSLARQREGRVAKGGGGKGGKKGAFTDSQLDALLQ